MIIARGMRSKDNEEVILFGLSNENIGRLLLGEPIFITKETHAAGCPEGWCVAIVACQTEAELMAALQRVGLVTSDTAVMDLGWTSGEGGES